MLAMLNEVFSHFDTLVQTYELEKIRTIGDNYMVASGVPRARKDHADAIARLALDMREYAQDLPTQGIPIAFRFGINSGPVVGGVIGHLKFTFDVWGDTVNTASRMESTGLPGEIQIGPNTYALLSDHFCCEPRGGVEVKGKGVMATWMLRKPRTQAK
jgi:adenylate cyclase